MSSYIAILTIKNSILKPQKTAFGLPKTDLSSLVEKNFNNMLRKTNSILIKGKTVKKISEDNCVLTPHAGEFKRIFGFEPNSNMDKRINDVC